MEKQEIFTVECNVCKQRYDNWVGSTPCCGSLAFKVKEDGSVSKEIELFARVEGEFKNVTLDFAKK